MATDAPTLKRYTWAGAFSKPFDFSGALLEGQTVASVAATHVPPSGDAVTVSVAHTGGQSSGSITVPALFVTGMHEIRVVATLATPTSAAAIRLPVEVN